MLSLCALAEFKWQLKMLMNSSMEPIWQEFQSSSKVMLPPELQKILNSKFVEMYDCIFLDSMLPDMWRSPTPGDSHFDDIPLSLKCFGPDKTSIERIVSKIHIDGCIQKNVMRKMKKRTNLCHFQYAMEFLSGVFELFRAQYSGYTLRGIISLNDGEPDGCFSCCVNYHVLREGESWVSEDIEGYEHEKIIVIDSNERHGLD